MFGFLIYTTDNTNPSLLCLYIFIKQIKQLNRSDFQRVNNVLTRHYLGLQWHESSWRIYRKTVFIHFYLVPGNVWHKITFPSAKTQKVLQRHYATLKVLLCHSYAKTKPPLPPYNHWCASQVDISFSLDDYPDPLNFLPKVWKLMSTELSTTQF